MPQYQAARLATHWRAGTAAATAARFATKAALDIGQQDTYVHRSWKDCRLTIPLAKASGRGDRSIAAFADAVSATSRQNLYERIDSDIRGVHPPGAAKSWPLTYRGGVDGARPKRRNAS
jgi:hypothetical protein